MDIESSMRFLFFTRKKSTKVALQLQSHDEILIIKRSYHIVYISENMEKMILTQFYLGQKK